MQNHSYRNSSLNSAFKASLVTDLTRKLKAERVEGKVLYFVSFTFLQNSQYPLTPAKASNYLGTAYWKLCEYLCGNRNFCRSWFIPLQPDFYAFLDVPGSKPKHYMPGCLPSKTSSYHYHGVLLADSRHEAKLDALGSCSKHRPTFGKVQLAHAKVKSYDFQKIGQSHTDIEKVAEYCTSWAANRLTDQNMYEVFPPSRCERCYVPKAGYLNPA